MARILPIIRSRNEEAIFQNSGVSNAFIVENISHPALILLREYV
jgi:hypothetical protein